MAEDADRTAGINSPLALEGRHSDGMVLDEEVMAIVQCGFGPRRSALLARLVAKRLSPLDDEAGMPERRSGCDLAAAQRAYEEHSGATLAAGGVLPHPRLAGAGARPDSLVGRRGLVQFDCLSTAGRFDMLVHGQARDREMRAIWQLACTGRDWCDIASFDARAPDGLQLVVRRMRRDEAEIRALESEIASFLNEVEVLCAALRSVGYLVPEVEMKRSEFPLTVKRQAVGDGGFCEAVGGVYGLEPGVRCNAPLVRGVEFDHYPVRAADGGDGTLDNCVAACRVCHRHKTRTFDMPMIAKRKRIVDRNAGIRKTGSFLTNRMGPMKRKMNGETVAR